ncbi:MAG TPA: hypothetical protein VFO18_04760 [Methylomirabilota bacterium]|nr:hypothetical protein [Methylomirabilota bacterium]
MSTPNGSGRNSHWWSGDAVVDSFDFGLAHDTDTFDQAFRLVHDRYVEQGYMQRHPSGRRLSLFHALPSSSVFVVKDGSRVAATLTLIEDATLGLPMDDLYRDELNLSRAQGRRLAEVSALALDPRYRAHGVSIVMRMMRLTYAFAAVIARLDDICIAVNPRHVDFYRNALNFHAFGALKRYKTVNDAPAVAMRLDLVWARDRMLRLQAGEAPDMELEEFFFSPAACAWSFGHLGRGPRRSRFSAEQFVQFLADQEEAIASARSGALSRVIRSFYPGLSPEALDGPGVSPTPAAVAAGSQR